MKITKKKQLICREDASRHGNFWPILFDNYRQIVVKAAWIKINLELYNKLLLTFLSLKKEIRCQK